MHESMMRSQFLSGARAVAEKNSEDERRFLEIVREWSENERLNRPDIDWLLVHCSQTLTSVLWPEGSDGPRVDERIIASSNLKLEHTVFVFLEFLRQVAPDLSNPNRARARSCQECGDLYLTPKGNPDTAFCEETCRRRSWRKTHRATAEKAGRRLDTEARRLDSPDVALRLAKHVARTFFNSGVEGATVEEVTDVGKLVLSLTARGVEFSIAGDAASVYAARRAEGAPTSSAPALCDYAVALLERDVDPRFSEEILGGIVLEIEGGVAAEEVVARALQKADRELESRKRGQK